MHPGGRNYDRFPVNSHEAESRRLARFSRLGHTPGRCAWRSRRRRCEFPYTLDLRVERECSSVLRQYAAPAGHYDEVREASGAVRPHWAGVRRRDRRPSVPPSSPAAQRSVARQLHDNGVTYNVQAAGSAPRAWTLDVLPHIVPAAEWEPIADGLRQRARLLEAVAADLYGPQHLLTRGTLPAGTRLRSSRLHARGSRRRARRAGGISTSSPSISAAAPTASGASWRRGRRRRPARATRSRTG